MTIIRREEEIEAMDETYTIKTLEQVKLLSDPLRLQILECLAYEELTTKQVAERLGEKPTKLYHHVAALEQAGLIRLVNTRQNRGTTEKYYRCVAKQFRVDHSLFDRAADPEETKSELLQMLAGPLERTLSEIRESVKTGLINPEEQRRTAVLGTGRIRISEASLEKMKERVLAWLDEYNNADEEAGDLSFILMVAFYPVATKETADEQL
jgi:DNA-binding transcriptional ArsR family regulator